MGLIRKIKRMWPKVQFEYRNKRHFFNPASAFWYALCPFLKQLGKSRHRAVLSYLASQGGIVNIIKELSSKKNESKETIKDDCPIWVMWWQGESSYPPIVEKCIASIKRNANSHPVHLLTKDNYQEFISIPKEVKDNIMKTNCIAYMSDVIRFGLLSQYGGIWLDATIYVSLPVTSWDIPIYSIRHQTTDPRFVLDGYRWSSFMVASVPNETLPTFVYRALLEYFSRHDVLIDYFLSDYLIATIYLNNVKVKQQIDELPKDNLGALELLMNLSKPYDKDRLEEILHSRRFHKLDWRYNITDANSMFAHLL